MTQPTYYQLPNEAGLAFRQHLNENLYGQQSDFAGATSPTDTQPYMRWLDTSVDPPVLRRRSSDNLSWGADNIFVENVDIGGGRTQADKNAEFVCVTDYPYLADSSGAVDATAAFISALASGAKAVFIPNGTYSISGNIEIPAQTFLIGSSLYWTVINVTSDVTPFTLRTLSKIANLRITKTGTHTSNGIEVGSTLLDGARSVIESVYIQGMGNDGIQVRKGNLGTIRDVVCLANGRDGINFTNETVDNNAWKLEGFIDVRSNTRDGLHLKGGTSVSDASASRSHSCDLVSSQQNGRYGVYSGSRSNRIISYAEANATADFYLDTFATGNDVVALEGSTLTEITAGSSRISWHNRNADYYRVERSTLQLSGKSNGGWQVNADDATAGIASFKKVATREFTLALAGSANYQNLHIINSESGQVLYTDFGGPVMPTKDNAHTLGNGSRRWSVIYAGAGTINTSDEREKSFAEISDAETACAKELKSMIRKFQFNDAIAEKGSDARYHFGVGAQSVGAVFESYGLDPYKYALFCYDEWEEQQEIKDEDGKVIQEYRAAGNRYGIRYEELLCFIVANI